MRKINLFKINAFYQKHHFNDRYINLLLKYIFKIFALLVVTKCHEFVHVWDFQS